MEACCPRKFYHCNNTKCEVIAVLLTVDGHGGGRGGRDKVQGGELLNLNWFYLIKLSILASQKCSLDNFFFTILIQSQEVK